MKYCPKCGCPCEETETVCMICNTPLNQNTSTKKESSITANTPSSRPQPKRIPVDTNSDIKRVNQTTPNRRKEKSYAYNTNRTPAPRRIKKKKSMFVPILLLALAAISLLAVILFCFLGRSNDTMSPHVSASSEGKPLTSQSGSSILGLSKSKDTLYVVDGWAFRYSNGFPTVVNTYEFSKDGVPICTHQGYSDNHDPASTTYYILADDEFAKKTAKYAIDSLGKSVEERTSLDDNYAKLLQKVLNANGFDLESQADHVRYEIFGIENNTITSITDVDRGTVELLKHNSLGKVEERSTYEYGQVIDHSETVYLSNGKTDSHDRYLLYSQMQTHQEYIYGANDKPMSSTTKTTWYDGSTTTKTTDYTYDNNGFTIKTAERGNPDNDMIYSYHFSAVAIPQSSLEQVKNLYSQLGILFIETNDPSIIQNTISDEEMAYSTAVPVEWKGMWSLAQIQNNNGFWVKYLDGSFDKYDSGYVLNWKGPDPMTYGADYTPVNLLMDTAAVSANVRKIKDGQLVLVCSSDNRVRAGIVPVEYSGFTMARYNEDNKKEALFFSKVDDGSEVYVRKWVRGGSIGNSVNCSTINGIPLEQYGSRIATSGYNRYSTFAKTEKYTIGIASGSTVTEYEYWTDGAFYFQKEVKPFDVKLAPTVDGYAIVDLSGIPAGDYILYYSYWADKGGGRTAMTTLITIE